MQFIVKALGSIADAASPTKKSKAKVRNSYYLGTSFLAILKHETYSDQLEDSLKFSVPGRPAPCLFQIKSMTFQSEGHFLISSLAPGLVSILHCFGPRSVPQESVCSGGVQQYLAACMEVLTARALAPGPQSQGTCPHHCTLPTALCPQTSQTPEIGSLLNSWDVSLLRLNGMRQTKIFYSEKLRKRKMK